MFLNFKLGFRKIGISQDTKSRLKHCDVIGTHDLEITFNQWVFLPFSLLVYEIYPNLAFLLMKLIRSNQLCLWRSWSGAAANSGGRGFFGIVPAFSTDSCFGAPGGVFFFRRFAPAWAGTAGGFRWTVIRVNMENFSSIDRWIHLIWPDLSKISPIVNSVKMKVFDYMGS